MYWVTTCNKQCLYGNHKILVTINYFLNCLIINSHCYSISTQLIDLAYFTSWNGRVCQFCFCREDKIPKKVLNLWGNKIHWNRIEKHYQDQAIHSSKICNYQRIDREDHYNTAKNCRALKWDRLSRHLISLAVYRFSLFFFVQKGNSKTSYATE